VAVESPVAVGSSLVVVVVSCTGTTPVAVGATASGSSGVDMAAL
jgi:hypothetical protein